MPNKGKYADIKKTSDRGPREFRSHKPRKEGNIMYVAEKNVVTTHAHNSIKNVAKIMLDNDFRRIPVTDAGTNRLEGLAVAMDIIDFLGGGEKYNIIRKDYSGNFLAAVNCPIDKIMRAPSYLDRQSSITDVINIMLSKRTSAIPIVNDEETREVIAIVTERDVMPMTDGFDVTIAEVMQTRCITSSLGMMISDVSKIMVRNGLRRLPVIQDGKLIGVVTQLDVLKFLTKGDFKSTDADENLSARVEQLMERNVVTVSPDEDLARVSQLVKETNLGGFPVVENGNLAGIVTTTDVLRWMYREGK